jgi:hypothetical protein
MCRVPLVLVCACVLLAHSRSLAAQATADTTTASFRQAEWGVGFLLRNNVTDAGILRFSTPTRALVLDGSGSFDRTSQIGAGVFGTDQTAQSTSVSAQLGPRWYHAITGHVARYLGFGVSGAYEHSQLSDTPNHTNVWSMGAYGEIGMQYLITRYLGLGWRGTISATRYDANTTAATTQGVTSRQEATSYHLGLDAVQLTGTIYF